MTNATLHPENGPLAQEDVARLLAIIKALGSGPRLQIMRTLTIKAHSFQDLQQASTLQKTALSNHLTQLQEAGLISKPEYGIYAITPDGALFLTAILHAYSKSFTKGKVEVMRSASGGLSEVFLKDFFGRQAG